MRRLHAALWQPVPMHWAVGARIGLGAVYLVASLQLLPHLLPLFGAGGLLGARSLERVFGSAAGGSLDLPDPVIVGLYLLLIGASTCFLIGLRARLAGVALVILHGLFWARQPLPYSGWPHLSQCLVIYLVLADAGRWGGVDARRAGRRGVGEGPAWPLRLFQLHVSLLYLSVGLPRLVDEAWRGGLMVYAALTYDRYARFSVDWQPWLRLLRPLDWATLGVEPLAGLLLWWRPARVPLLCALVPLHLGLELLTRTGFWQPVMLVSLLAFVPPAWLRRLAAVGARNEAAAY